MTDDVADDRLLALAERAARAAGDVLLERFGGPARGVEAKSSRTDLVSDADREAERAILAVLADERPGDPVLTEESGAIAGAGGVRWIVDPLDGTTNFLYGLAAWSVSIAAEDADGLLCGVVHDPLAGETFTAARGRGSRLGDRRIAASGLLDLDRALVATGFSYLAAEREVQACALPAVLPRVRDVRRAGSAALDLAWTACGRVDGFYEVPLMRWDVAAGVLLVREAGGIVSPLPAVGPRGDGLVAAGAGIHGPLSALVGGALASGTRSVGEIGYTDP